MLPLVSFVLFTFLCIKGDSVELVHLFFPRGGSGWINGSMSVRGSTDSDAEQPSVVAAATKAAAADTAPSLEGVSGQEAMLMHRWNRTES